jgi:ABC-type branched-subunit amino acid transport system substrate-binding protein
MRLRRKVTAVTTTIAVLGAVAIASVPAAASGARGSGGPQVKVMVIAQLTAGESGAAVSQTPAAVKARVKIANQRHELPGGQTLVVEVCDDKENENTAAACARQAVDDGVVAVLGATTSKGDAINPILEEAGIANIGQVPLSFSDYGSPISFPLQAGIPGYLCGSLLRLQKKNLNKIDVAYIDIPAGAQTVALAGLCMPDGVELSPTSGTPVPPTSPDLTAAVTAASQDSDAIILATLAPSAAQFIKTSKQQSVKQPLLNSNSGFTQETLGQLGDAANGVLTTNAYASLNSKVPGIVAFKAAMKKYAKGEDADDQFALGAWLATDVLVNMAKAQKLTALSKENVLQGMGSITGLKTGGIIPPLTTTTPLGFASLARIFNKSVFPGVVKNGKNVGAGKPYDALVELPTS